MEVDALAPYEQSLSTHAPLDLHHSDGRTIRLDIERWLGDADAADIAMVGDAVSPVLDVGCGPGRILVALAMSGRFGLGIDIAKTAVELAEARGVTVLHRDVFGRLPGEGRWRTVLLLDGNVGIGGDVHRLLHRVQGLLAPGGIAVVETHHDALADETLSVRFARGGVPLGPQFPWCIAGHRTVRRAARHAGFGTAIVDVASGRQFVTLHNDARA